MTEYVRLKNTLLNDKREVLGRHTAEDGREYVWLAGSSSNGPSMWYASDTEPWVPEPAAGQVWRLNDSAYEPTIMTVAGGWVIYTNRRGGDRGDGRTVESFKANYTYVSGPDA